MTDPISIQKNVYKACNYSKSVFLKNAKVQKIPFKQKYRIKSIHH